jgi:hypothetical protein
MWNESDFRDSRTQQTRVEQDRYFSRKEVNKLN